ncbi:class I SAM-dependent methyltransferase [candidate division TA06 bacterium]|uniref:Class I SAM-dependent methyltransferase n=1 Tax=candidate division TA06 bacterium TaxID=2250710 RepID=A0A933IA22_UNCT6|nr:class I SAM-dependent methyltransferase [candidate division TA06 bacterium]
MKDSSYYKQRVEAEVQKRTYRSSKYSDWHQEILSYVRGVVLDLGAGDGAFTVPLTRQGLRVVACDLSRTRLQNLKACTSELVELNAMAIPFKPSVFDTILFIEVLEHLPDRSAQQRLLTELGRVLKPGGVVVLTTPNRPVYRIMTMLWKWLGSQEPDPTHYAELSWPELEELCREKFDIAYVRGKAGLIPLCLVQRLLSKKLYLCYDIMVALKHKGKA